MAWPFVTQAVCVALGVVLVARMATQKGGVRDVTDTHVRRDVAEGVRWLMGHAAVRTLALVIFVFNVTWGAAWSVLVLYSLDRLHMGEVGFGLLTSAAAIGGLAGTVVLRLARAPRPARQRHARLPAPRGPDPPRARADHRRRGWRWS